MTSEEMVRKHWEVVVGPDDTGRIDLGVLPFVSNLSFEDSQDPAKVWDILAEFTLQRLEKARDLQEYIKQVSLEMAVNSNSGTARSAASDKYWTSKNLRWLGISNILREQLDCLVEGMKGWEIDGEADLVGQGTDREPDPRSQHKV